ncbi:MAG: DUF4276 family protein [Clostridium sp.]|nr:DUF4276 family protein [Acetatifactor muris]MCM1561984.1 DUF4276 family protein [Clostridium sp.]
MKLIFLLEEQSMKYFLDGLLPRILPAGIRFITVPHEGKSDLQKSLTAKLQGWNEPNVKFVVVQDQDSNDCKKLKEKLLELCRGSNKEVLVRIACHELESWYFGDMDSLGMAYDRDLSVAKRKSKYRIPDAIVNPKTELRRLLPEHQQIAGAKKIAPIINIDNNTSVSFQMFINGVRRLAEIGV